MTSFQEVLHELGLKAEDAFGSLELRMARETGREEPLLVTPYRGYGTSERLSEVGGPPRCSIRS